VARTLTLEAKLKNIVLLHSTSQTEDLVNQLRIRISQNCQNNVLKETWKEQRNTTVQDISNISEDKKTVNKSDRIKVTSNLISEKVKKSIMSLDPMFEMISNLSKVKSKEELRVERNNHKTYINNLHRQ
jgi:hypothetical protein